MGDKSVKIKAGSFSFCDKRHQIKKGNKSSNKNHQGWVKSINFKKTDSIINSTFKIKLSAITFYDDILLEVAKVGNAAKMSR